MKRIVFVFFLCCAFRVNAQRTIVDMTPGEFSDMMSYAVAAGLFEYNANWMGSLFSGDGWYYSFPVDEQQVNLSWYFSPDGVPEHAYLASILEAVSRSATTNELLLLLEQVADISSSLYDQYGQSAADLLTLVQSSVSPLEFRYDDHGAELLVAAPDLESVLGDLQYTFSQSSIIASDTSQSLQADVVPLLRYLVSNMVPTTLQMHDAEDITNALPADLAEDHETNFEEEYEEAQDDLDTLAPEWSDQFIDNPYDYGGNITNTLLNGMLNLVDDVDPVTSPELIIMGSYDTPTALEGAARLPRIAVNLEDNLRRSNALRFCTTVMSALWLIVGVFYKFSALQKFVDWYTKKSKGF